MRRILLYIFSFIVISADASDLSGARERCKNFVDARIYDMAIEPCQTVANSGDTEYQFKLVIALASDGQLGKAAKWAGELTDNGVVGACQYMGLKYVEKKDINNAISWFEMCANSGNALSATTLGIIYLHGGYPNLAENAIDRDEEKGVKWLEHAAEHGDGNAISELIGYYQSINDEEKVRLWTKRLQ